MLIQAFGLLGPKTLIGARALSGGRQENKLYPTDSFGALAAVKNYSGKSMVDVALIGWQNMLAT